MRRRDRERGSLTVFLALLLPVFLMFSGVCLEYARAQVLSFQVQTAAASAAQSIFAGYSRPLFSQYQLMARLVSGEDFTALSEETEKYASSYGEGGSLASFRVTEALWQDVVFATDENGAVFSAMAAAAMKSSAVEIVAEDWLSRLGLSGSGKQTETLKENAAKDTLSADSLLSGYSDWASAVETAEEDLTSGTEEVSAEPGGDSTTEGEKGKGYLNLLETVKKTLRYGILGLVVPEDRSISQGTVSGENLPSALSATAKSRSVGTSVSAAGDGILLREYLVRNLDCFTSENSKAVSYELEYVLAGKSTDEANLKSAVHRLLWIRTGMNFLYLSQSAEKKAQVREAATLAVGWLGQPLLVEGMTVLLLTVWAFSEGIVDVRSLLDGGKVPLTKSDSGWNLSLDKLADSWSGSGQWEQTDKEEGGLSYEDYLRICLYLTEEETCCYRAMDVIQWNVQGSEADFVLANCIVSGSLSLTAEASPLFAGLYGTDVGADGLEYTRYGSASYFT